MDFKALDYAFEAAALQATYMKNIIELAEKYGKDVKTEIKQHIEIITQTCKELDLI